MGLYRIAMTLAWPMLPASVRLWRAESAFFNARGWQNLHLGKFASAQEAASHATGIRTHYRIDHKEWAQIQSTIKAHDYPVMYWLDRLLEPGGVLCDFGGSIGVSYYAYKPCLRFPQGLSWIVCELPEPAKLGAEMAAERDAPGLSFTTDRAAMDGCDVLLAAGVLPFVEPALDAMLAALERPPRHVLLNRLPLCVGMDGYYTLQNTGHSITPMRIANRDAFVSAMARVGYDLTDEWKCLENSLHIPLHPECTLRHFKGLYFQLRVPVPPRGCPPRFAGLA